MVQSKLVEVVKTEMKAAMKARDKARLQTIRLIRAEFKRLEVDERAELTQEQALHILDKMLKQRRDSASQYQDAGREDLANKELHEINVIQEFLPPPLSKLEIEELLEETLASLDESGMQAMGKVMSMIKPKIQGRADVGQVSKLVKERLIG